MQGIRKNAVAAYSWFEEAGDFATYTAAIDGVSTASDDTTPQVRGYFDTLFSGITQTTANGNEYDPAAGSPFKGPIELTGFTPYNQGATLPNGSQANADGYWISATVPVFVGTVPFVGLQTVNVPMSYYAQL
jgi:hypothetical protein